MLVVAHIFVRVVKRPKGDEMMALTIGLTGGIATGKSTVSDMFKQFEIPVIDADVISRDVVKPGRSAYQQIVHTFGQRILRDDLIINRKELGHIIFSDETERKKLNSIVHPAVRKEMLKQRKAYIASGAHVVVLDIPLLFESDLGHLVDKVLVVYVDSETQLERLLKRDAIETGAARQRIRAQMPLEEKITRADAAINNNGSIEETKEQLLDILNTWHIY